MLATIRWADFIQPLVLFGFAAQFVFMMRFLIQWFVSERRGRSYVPVIFWWISLLGGVMLFVYALLREDLVIMAGQLLGSVIYARNLMLIYQRRARVRSRMQRGFAVTPAAEVEAAREARVEVAPGVEVEVASQAALDVARGVEAEVVKDVAGPA